MNVSAPPVVPGTPASGIRRARRFCTTRGNGRRNIVTDQVTFLLGTAGFRAAQSRIGGVPNEKSSYLSRVCRGDDAADRVAIHTERGCSERQGHRVRKDQSVGGRRRHDLSGRPCHPGQQARRCGHRSERLHDLRFVDRWPPQRNRLSRWQRTHLGRDGHQRLFHQYVHRRDRHRQTEGRCRPGRPCGLSPDRGEYLRRRWLCPLYDLRRSEA